MYSVSTGKLGDTFAYLQVCVKQQQLCVHWCITPVNYRYNPTYSQNALSEQCMNSVEGELKQIEGIQTKLGECLQAPQNLIKLQFDRYQTTHHIGEWVNKSG